MPKLDFTPRISIVMPVYNVPLKWFERAVASVEQQIYSNWELCVYDDCSTDAALKDYLNRLEGMDSRIKVSFGHENKGIVGATNAAITAASGEFVAFMDNDDELSPDALLEVAIALQDPTLDLIYSDEDKIDTSGKFCEPYYKPDWSPELLLSGNYVSHLAVYRKTLGDELGWLREGYDGSQDFDFNLRVSEKTNKIFHIPKVLYHWRKIPGSTADDAYAKPYAYVAGQRALEDHASRSGYSATVTQATPGHYRYCRKTPADLAVSIIPLNTIQSPNRWEHDPALVGGTVKLEFMRLTDSNLPLSEKLNDAVLRASGDVILFLSPSISRLSEEGIRALAEHALRSDVAAVGGKLVCRNRIVQAGIVVGTEHDIGMAYKGFHRMDFGYFGGLIDSRNCSAVHSSCMMCNRATFIDNGGFSNEFSDTLFDIDYCLRLHQRGLLTVFTPHAEFEACSFSMAPDDNDLKIFKIKWGHHKDPYYNPNLNQAEPNYRLGNFA
ncbi:glycosyltransferase [Alicyclobacillus acidiphilus]|uniref:glycosyltransferase n=1 Tax=Alicyclobacillus acidiphilus TaxID=182455 RepID=UPI0012EE291E|nr:glycosyltransferase [Alicyclobacillus acidiphilus]